MCEKEGCGEGGKKGMMVYRVKLFRVQDFKILFPLLPRHPPPIPHTPVLSYFLVGCIKVCTLHSPKFAQLTSFLDQLSQGSSGALVEL